jgi:hypothetical protein
MHQIAPKVPLSTQILNLLLPKFSKKNFGLNRFYMIWVVVQPKIPPQ